MGRGAASFYEGNRKGIGKWRAEIAGGGRKRETGNRVIAASHEPRAASFQLFEEIGG